MKFIFRLIGIIVVLIILIMAVLFYLDAKGLLIGKLGRLIGSLRRLGNEAWSEIRYFANDTGISEDAAGLLVKAAEFIQESVSPHATEKPGVNALTTPEPTAIPTPIVVG